MIEFIELAYYAAIFTIPMAIYAVFYKTNDWYYLVKFVLAKRAVKRYQRDNAKSLEKHTETIERIREIRSNEHEDNHFFYGVDQNGNSLTLRFTMRSNFVAEIFVNLRILGENYKIPNKNSLKLTRVTNLRWKDRDVHLEITEPLKRVRVTFNGLLENDRNHLKHVNFNFIWISANRATFFPQGSSTKSLAKVLGNTKWRDGNWITQLGDERGYDQFGTLNGFVSIEGNRDDITVILPSSRSRFWGTSPKLSYDRCLHLFIAGRDGLLFDIYLKQLRNGTRLIKGYVINHEGVKPIDDVDVNLDNMTSFTGTIPKVLTVHIKVGTSGHKCVCHIKCHEQVTAVNNESHGYYLINVPCECDLNTEQASGIIEFWYRHTGDASTRLPPPLLKESVAFDSSDYVVKFEDEQARSVKLSGGKGCSLALMSTIETNDFDIPDGFVVTTNAYNHQLVANSKLTESVTILDDICCGRSEGDLESACAQTVKCFKDGRIDEDVRSVILEHLKQLRNDDEDVKFAVRSSGVGEDGEELSAAGQNDTFLGIRSDEDVIEAITSCWASLYTHQSVEYRHQHGCAVRTEMAVVVQKMVAAECAGVLFTCHPTTSNPSEIVITSNYGLGESVVSGQSDPDTVIVTRQYDNSVTIRNKEIGQKNKIVKMSKGTGIEEIELSTGKSDMSLTDQQILNLAKIGLAIEESFGNFRDIEWAIAHDRIHLLQSRPVTTMTSWTEYELTHEFDVPILSDYDIYTVANVGEVLPGATSILTVTSFLMSLDRAFQLGIDKGVNIDRDRLKCMQNFYNHIFLNVINSLHLNPKKEIHMSAKVLDLAIFGHPIINERIHRAALARWGIKSPLGVAKLFLTQIKNAWNNDARVRVMAENVRAIDVGIDERIDTLEEIYVKIDRYLDEITEKVCLHHCLCSSASVFYQIVALNVLAERNEDFTVDHYHDIASLLSSCQDVISAEIPKTFEKITKIIESTGKLAEFTQIPPESGQQWLQSNCPNAYDIFRQFLKDHGHRAFGEFDLITETWDMNPSKVIKMLQANSKVNSKTDDRPPVKSIDDVIAGLVSPSSDITRKILKFVVTKARKVVGMREQTKCELVRAVHKLRLAYNFLALKMAHQGILPNKQLIYHLSHYEVKLLIDRDTQTPVLVTKALRRMRLYEKWDHMKFPEICYGFPRPEPDDEDTSNDVINGECFRLEGTPVCSGVVKARACVITSLQQIDQLENGDILITYCTDIGWSPYFPMISGIVTELGGLISHGAVIAREYGLPSIVGVQKATRMFKTGDLVHLSGTDGVIHLISR